MSSKYHKVHTRVTAIFQRSLQHESKPTSKLTVNKLGKYRLKVWTIRIERSKVHRSQRADILPLQSRGSLVNKRFIKRLKMLLKNAKTDRLEKKKQRKVQVLNSDWEPDFTLRLMLIKTKGKESWKEKKRIFDVKTSSFKNVINKVTRKSSRVIVRVQRRTSLYNETTL